MTSHPGDGLADLVEPGAAVVRVAKDCIFTEGPVWLPDGSLLFSDIPANRLMRWHPDEGQSVLREPNAKGNGMTLDNAGRLVVCEHATSTVTRGTPGGERTPIASHWQGRELNSPNDVIVASDGSVIFTDPTFGRLMESVGVVRNVEQDIQGVYRVPADGGDLELLVDDMAQPNGLCLSRDESLLYVGDTARAHIRVFEMTGARPLGRGRVFAEGITETAAGDDGYVDGMKLDERGNVYVTGPGGVWVYAPDGARLGTIEVPEQVANLNWGDADWRSLYLTANTSVYRIRMQVAGHRLGYMR
ncbi:SMP-30/gluconolactonase/LRE family protein [Geodermatophilus ruber]|uniref:Gluconolactonase n=1 Tax=Geodermatophilus ruber TaxID=504800 RepID=A0A1I4G5Y7_9ACTN|nr:SMP-30/gluconolactonase/LRE family protein [Geodermatophilus ruber]SFL24677.1 gluconolactonase [Geodermatophilus ruber]